MCGEKGRAHNREKESPVHHLKTSLTAAGPGGLIEILFDSIVTRTEVLVKREARKKPPGVKFRAYAGAAEEALAFWEI